MKTLKTTAISVLDLAKVSQGKSIRETYESSKALAQHVERLGYTRYWLAEHHNIEGIASAATSVLIGFIAQNTTSIRVGSGGIMLPNHSPLIVAEQFGTLETLYPGRIDLGVGRAPGTDQITTRAIRREDPKQAPDLAELIEQVLYYFAPAKPGQMIRAVPGAGITVPLYILGSSIYSAELAAKLGRPYAFAGHFAPGAMMQAFDIYRSLFQPSAVLEKPYVMMGIPVVAAETDEHAVYLATSIQQAFLGLVRGSRKLSAVPVVDMNTVWTPREKEAVDSMLSMLVTGSPEKVKKDLDAMIEATGADELIITSDTHDHEDRMRSYDLIAKAKAL